MAVVDYEVRGAAAWVTLDRPEKRNALSPEMIRELDIALDRALADSTVRAVVLTGRGRAFCSGADLDSQRTFEGDRDKARNPLADLLRRIQTLKLPVIAAVNGPAFGGGLGLMAATDIVIAADSAVFSFSEVRLGLIPAMISVVVLPRVGSHHARRLFLTGRRFTSAEAVDYGLVHCVVEAEALQAAVDEEVAEVALCGPNAVGEAKRLIREVSALDEDAAFDRTSQWIAELAASDEGREGVAAFVQKRKPSWCA